MSAESRERAAAVDARLGELELRVGQLEELVLPEVLPAPGAPQDPLQAAHQAFRARARAGKGGEARG